MGKVFNSKVAPYYLTIMILGHIQIFVHSAVDLSFWQLIQPMSAGAEFALPAQFGPHLGRILVGRLNGTDPLRPAGKRPAAKP